VKMLGKGLESLIPKGGNIPKDDGAKTPPADPPVVSSGAGNISDEADPVFTRAFGDAHGERIRRPQGQESIFHLEVEKIKPNPLQPRREFNEESLRELANSIREFGILQPLIVTKIEKEVPTGTDVEYQLIAGERRLMAAKLLGFERVPAIVKKIDIEKERLEIAIIENIQREDLNPLETARAFSRLQDEFRLTQREIAARLGKSREAVANTMRLLDLPSYIQDAVSKGEISESHGRLLLAVADKGAQEKLFRDLVDRHLTTRELKYRVQGTKPGGEQARASRGTILGTPLSPELLALQEQLSSELGAPVKIEQHGPSADGGKITITYFSSEELKGIFHRLARDGEG